MANGTITPRFSLTGLFSSQAVCACAVHVHERKNCELELELWIHCYGKLSYEMRYLLLQSLLGNFVSSHLSGFAEIVVAWLQRGPHNKTEF